MLCSKRWSGRACGFRTLSERREGSDPRAFQSQVPELGPKSGDRVWRIQFGGSGRISWCFVPLAPEFVGAGVQISLENEDGSDLVDDLFVAASRAPGGVQMPVGLGGGQAFIPQVHRQPRFGGDQG